MAKIDIGFCNPAATEYNPEIVPPHAAGCNGNLYVVKEVGIATKIESLRRCGGFFGFIQYI